MRKEMIALVLVVFLIGVISAVYSDCSIYGNCQPSAVKTTGGGDTTNNYYNATGNATQFTTAGDTLTLKESWLTTFWNAIFGTKTTDDLTEGTTNFYDNRSFNQSLTDGRYAFNLTSAIQELLNFTGIYTYNYNHTLTTYNLWNVDWLSTYNATYDAGIKNHTNITFNLWNSTWDNRPEISGVSSNLSSINTTLNIGSLYNTTSSIITNLSISQYGLVNNASYLRTDNSSYVLIGSSNQTRVHCSNLTGNASDLCTVSGGSMDYTNIAMTNKSNTFTLNNTFAGDVNITGNLSIGGSGFEYPLAVGGSGVDTGMGFISLVKIVGNALKGLYIGYSEIGQLGVIASQGVDSGIAFYGVNSTGYIERMRINTDGNVGIGTPYPTHTFNVLGGANITGDLIVKELNLSKWVIGTQTNITSINNSAVHIGEVNTTKIDCHNVTGGTDADYCTDATGAGSGTSWTGYNYTRPIRSNNITVYNTSIMSLTFPANKWVEGECEWQANSSVATVGIQYTFNFTTTGGLVTGSLFQDTSTTAQLTTPYYQATATGGLSRVPTADLVTIYPNRFSFHLNTSATTANFQMKMKAEAAGIVKVWGGYCWYIAS